MKTGLFILWGALVSFSCLGQAPQARVALRVVPSDKPAAWLKGQQIKVPATAPDSLAALAALRGMVQQLRDASYLEASADTIIRQDSVWTVLLHVGDRYEWLRLHADEDDAYLLARAGYQERSFKGGQRFEYRQVSRMMERTLVYLENHGYPFARVWLDSISIGQGGVSARLRLHKGALITFGEIDLTAGDAGISQGYLSRYLGILPGELYNRAKVLRLRNRLLELPFVKIKRDAIITFLGDKATVSLFLERNNASRFNFLIGVLPNNTQSGRVLITGTFDGELHNQFGAGERIFAKFEQLRPLTQNLNVAFDYPYIFGTAIGADASLDLYKRDTNFLNAQYGLGLNYLLEEGSAARAYWQQQSTTLLSIDANAIRARQQLPDTLDITRSTFGLEYTRQQLDYRYNPRRGWLLSLGAGAGTKQVRRNNLIDQLDVGDLYAQVPLRSFQYRIHARLAGYLPMWQRFTLKAELQGGYIVANAAVYANEQFRIGGNRLLRGFDEEFIFATNYTVFTLEYRLLLGRNSFLYAFGDLARVDATAANALPGSQPIDFPYGLGAGITFETRAGIFGFSLAYGSRRDSPVDLSAPKVHLGYVSMF